ncbi:MAG: hypothetical protein IJX08_04280 [Clostridia bacterium]|nr:hypothetical protein [Clostridia bacterium]
MKKILSFVFVLCMLACVLSACGKKGEALPDGFYMTTYWYYLDSEQVTQEMREEWEKTKNQPIMALQFYEDSDEVTFMISEELNEEATAKNIYEWESSHETYRIAKNGALFINSLGNCKYTMKSNGRMVLYVKNMVIELKRSNKTPYDLRSSYERWQAEQEAKNEQTES